MAFAGDQEAGDDAVYRAARGRCRGGGNPHQADIAAAIDEATARPGDRLADRFGRIGIGFAFTET